MQLFLLKSKIQEATVTQTELYYQGSLTLDRALMSAASLVPGERVQVLNLNNGSRIETYIIEGEKGSGTVCLNGPAAREGIVGDRIHILSYAMYSEEEASEHQPKVVSVGDDNRIEM